MRWFSERYGYRSVREILQIDDLSEGTRIRIWNLLYKRFFEGLSYRQYLNRVNEDCLNLCYYLYDRYFKISTQFNDDDEEEAISIYIHLHNYVKDSDWFNVYDLIEAIIKFSEFSEGIVEFIKDCNHLLEEELCGYRIISGFVTPIITTTEIAEIEEALQQPFDTVYKHLNTALEFFSDRMTPNYPNSVKESISAVECICRIILSEKNITLGAALRKLKDEGVSIHGALRTGLSNIYGWTSANGGIRHARIDDSDIGFDEAKLMIVLCSAFINFLIKKAEKVGINLKSNYEAMREK